MADHIELRGNRYYAVLKVPQDARDTIGQSWFRKTLRTDSRRVAKQRAPAIVAEWRAEIDRARGNEDFTNELRAFRRRYLTADDENRESGEKTTRERIELEADSIAERFHPTDREASHELYKRLTGRTIDLDECLEEWLASIQIEEKTKDLRRKTVERFKADFPTIQSVTRGKVRRWVDGLVQEHRLSPSTAQRYLSDVRMYWRYLLEVEVVGDDYRPFDGVSAPKMSKRDKARAGYRQYEPDDVPKLVNGALASDNPRNTTLAALIALSAFTGARLDELCDAKVENIRWQGETPLAIDITDAKTASGIRAIPVANQIRSLVRELSSVAERRNENFLLPGLGARNKYADRSKAIGQRFGRLKRSLDFGEEHTFHSLRGTVIGKLVNQGHDLQLVQRVVGHQAQSVTYRHYVDEITLEKAVAMMDGITYPGIHRSIEMILRRLKASDQFPQ